MEQSAAVVLESADRSAAAQEGQGGACLAADAEVHSVAGQVMGMPRPADEGVVTSAAACRVDRDRAEARSNLLKHTAQRRVEAIR